MLVPLWQRFIGVKAEVKQRRELKFGTIYGTSATNCKIAQQE